MAGEPQPLRWLARLGVVTVLCLIVVGPWAGVPALAERTQGDVVLIREDDVVAEDLYAAGNRIRVAGRIEGDLLGVAFEEVRIEGEVTGSVTVAATRVVIAGVVGGSVSALAQEVIIEGEVGEDLFVAAWGVSTTPSSAVGRDVVAWGQNATLLGRIGRSFEGQQRSTRLSAAVDGDVEITVTALEVGPAARIAGDLAYRSRTAAVIDEAAEVEGSILHRRPLPPNVRIRAFFVLASVLGVITTTLLGLVVLWGLPDRSQRAARSVRDRPMASVLWGLGLVMIPVALALVGGLAIGLTPPAAGLPLLGVFGPLVIASLSLLLVALLVAPVPVAAAVGIVLARQRSVYAAFLLGMIVLVVVGLLPWIGRILVTLALAAGLGGWLLSGEA